MCGSLRCHACIVPTALNYARALAFARPTQQIMLTLVGEEHELILERMKRFHRVMRRGGEAFSHAYSVERNPRGTGTHLHGWVHGTPVQEARVAEAAVAAGMGAETWVGTVKTYHGRSGPMIKYGLKSVLDRPDNVQELWPEATDFLRLNGGRLVSATRGFWRNGQSGQTLAGVRPAIAAAREAAGLRGRYIWAAA